MGKSKSKKNPPKIKYLKYYSKLLEANITNSEALFSYLLMLTIEPGDSLT